MIKFNSVKEFTGFCSLVIAAIAPSSTVRSLLTSLSVTALMSLRVHGSRQRIMAMVAYGNPSSIMCSSSSLSIVTPTVASL